MVSQMVAWWWFAMVQSVKNNLKQIQVRVLEGLPFKFAKQKYCTWDKWRCKKRDLDMSSVVPADPMTQSPANKPNFKVEKKTHKNYPHQSTFTEHPWQFCERSGALLGMVSENQVRLSQLGDKKVTAWITRISILFSKCFLVPYRQFLKDHGMKIYTSPLLQPKKKVPTAENGPLPVTSEVIFPTSRVITHHIAIYFRPFVGAL